jgi:type I restriction enzyme R subunit
MPAKKEAAARIKINKLLENSGWRFFDDGDRKANIRLEVDMKLGDLGDDFENSETPDKRRGAADFVLLDDAGFPLVVVEAKREEKDPLDGKEQARSYAQSQNARFIILSNGNLHYFWDLERGNPEVITEFPTQPSLKHRQTFKPDNHRLAAEEVGPDYVALTQDPAFKDDPRYVDEATRAQYLYDRNLRILRDYQLRAVRELQKAAATGQDRYLFEMATGTGKTLVSAAVIKLFLKTGNARRVLFLVDRLELEDQAAKNLVRCLKNDYTTYIYKEHRDDWSRAEIVVATVQSLAAGDKYRRLFSPTDFDLVISDEAHRSISGNARAVFEYFVGYKLGLTATPKDYLKNLDPARVSANDPRAWERRQLLDTYVTFGCASGDPTFRYSLLDGVRDEVLVKLVAVDAHTDITTELLSEKGYAVLVEDEEGEREETFFQRDFERRFFSDRTNQVFCEAVLKSALRDPVSGEMGKTIVFCVSQRHASRITQILNQMADLVWPGKYNSDFAVQVTSNIPDAQQFTVNFANDNLGGHSQVLPGYRTSKTRVCVTVGMMTTGYDCPDLLNLALMRPVFSPTDFVQIKGRGTRRYRFEHRDEDGAALAADKTGFKLFDFFDNCKYFEEKFNYNEELKLPVQGKSTGPAPEPALVDEVTITEPDAIRQMTETPIGAEGMRVDRELFEKARAELSADRDIEKAVAMDQWDRAIQIIREKYEDKPELFLNLGKLQRSEKLDRRLTWREVLERVFGLTDRFPTKDEKLDDEVAKYISIAKPESRFVPLIGNYLKAYVTDEEFRRIIDGKDYAALNFYPGFGRQEFQDLDGWRDRIPEYVKDYVSLNQFM